jgi:hypothetical protein
MKATASIGLRNVCMYVCAPLACLQKHGVSVLVPAGREELRDEVVVCGAAVPRTLQAHVGGVGPQLRAVRPHIDVHGQTLSEGWWWWLEVQDDRTS